MLQVVLQHDLAADDARLIGTPIEPGRRLPGCALLRAPVLRSAFPFRALFLIEF
jgi:hypothetical protein